MTTTKERSNLGAMTDNKRKLPKDHTKFVKPETIPWTQAQLPGTDFKLLAMSEDGETVIGLYKVKAGTVLPPHRHDSMTLCYIIKGGFFFAADGTNPERTIGEGGFLYEPAGTEHQPQIPEDSIFLSIRTGSLRGVSADGGAVAYSPNSLLELAIANGAAAHLKG